MIPLAQEQIFRYIDAHLSLYLDEMKHSSALPATSGQSTERDAHLAQQLQGRGFATQLMGAGPHLLYGELHTGAAHTLLLYHHVDRRLPRHPSTPFAPSSHTVASSTLDQHNLAPNAALIACLAAIEAYQQVAGRLPVNIKWLIDTSSEDRPADTGTQLAHILEYNRHLLQADGCIYRGGSIPLDEDGTPYLGLGPKGLLRVELETCTTGSTLDSETGAIVPNPAWRLTWALASIKDEHEEILIDGFYDTLVPADDKEIELLQALPDNASWLAHRWGLDQLLLGLRGFQLHYTRFLVPTCTITSISSGSPVQQPEATIPTQAMARLDFHLVPGQDPEEVFARLQRHLHSHGFQDVQARMLSSNKPAHTPASEPFVEAVRQATIIAYGREPHILPLISSGGAIHPLCAVLNVPVVCIGVSETPLMGAINQAPADTAESAAMRDLGAQIKQMTMIFEEVSNATRTTE